jgi:molybdate transport system substrate-binding protein
MAFSKTMLKFNLTVCITSLMLCRVFAYAEDVNVSSGVGLRDVITAIYVKFKAHHPDANVRFNFAAAGVLAKQITGGAPADIFIPASSKWMDYLVAEGKIDTATVRIIAGNTLVVVGPQRKPLTSLADLTACHRIAIGNPGTVPVGDYAVQALQAAGVYEALVTQKKLVMAHDVRQALMYADRAEVDAAFVSRTDALRAESAVILYAVPDSVHDKIIYTMGLTTSGESNVSARSFYDYISSESATKIFTSYGFEGAQTENKKTH